MLKREMESVEKVLLIALDGATWDLLAPWMDGGAMPAQSYDGELEQSTADQQEKIVTRLQALGYLEGSE